MKVYDWRSPSLKIHHNSEQSIATSTRSPEINEVVCNADFVAPAAATGNGGRRGWRWGRGKGKKRAEGWWTEKGHGKRKLLEALIFFFTALSRHMFETAWSHGPTKAHKTFVGLKGFFSTTLPPQSPLAKKFSQHRPNGSKFTNTNTEVRCGSTSLRIPCQGNVGSCNGARSEPRRHPRYLAPVRARPHGRRTPDGDHPWGTSRDPRLALKTVLRNSWPKKRLPTLKYPIRLANSLVSLKPWKSSRKKSTSEPYFLEQPKKAISCIACQFKKANESAL